jgi:hypothetical protein
MKCHIYRFLYKMVPIKKWQVFCINRHFSACCKCREDFFAADSIGPIGITADKVKVPADAWWNIRKRIEKIEHSHCPDLLINKAKIKKKIKWSPGDTFNWKWAVAAMVILLLLVPFFIIRKRTDNIKIEKPVVVENREIIIQSVRIENQQANVVYFQPGTKNRLIVWVKK